MIFVFSNFCFNDVFSNNVSFSNFSLIVQKNPCQTFIKICFCF